MSGCSIQKPLLIVTWWWKWWFPSGFRSTTCSDKPMWAVEPKSSAILSTGWLTGSPPYWMMMIPYIPGSMIPYVLWTNHGLFSCKRGWYPPSTGFIYPWFLESLYVPWFFNMVDVLWSSIPQWESLQLVYHPTLLDQEGFEHCSSPLIPYHVVCISNYRNIYIYI